MCVCVCVRVFVRVCEFACVTPVPSVTLPTDLDSHPAPSGGGERLSQHADSLRSSERGKFITDSSEPTGSPSASPLLPPPPPLCAGGEAQQGAAAELECNFGRPCLFPGSMLTTCPRIGYNRCASPHVTAEEFNRAACSEGECLWGGFVVSSSAPSFSDVPITLPLARKRSVKMLKAKRSDLLVQRGADWQLN